MSKRILTLLLTPFSSPSKSNRVYLFEKRIVITHPSKMCSRRSAYAYIGVLVSAFHQSVAFSPNTIRPLHRLDGRTRLQSHAIDSEDEAMMTMMRATTCAHSETCSIEEAEKYLDEILNLQSSCVSGTLSSQQLCEDVLFTSEVISDLRQKIKDGKR
jgi:hypothetical protein